MFSSVLHFLALISFAVHTVFGCCAHHSHADLSECCEIAIHTDEEVAHTDCCDHHSHNHKSVAKDLDTQVFLCGGHQCSMDREDHSHGHGTHKCCEMRCVYINAVTVTTAGLLDNEALLVAILPMDSRWNCDKAYFHLADHHLFSTNGHGATLRCALQQSWQI